MNKKYIWLYLILISFIGFLYWMGGHQPIEPYIDTSHLGGTDTDLSPFHNNDDYDLQKQRFHHNKCCLGKHHHHTLQVVEDTQQSYEDTQQSYEDTQQSYSGNQNIDPSVSYISPDDIYIDESSSHQNCCSMMASGFNPEADFRPDFNPQEENVIIDITLSDDSSPESASPETASPETASPETASPESSNNLEETHEEE